MKNYDFCFPPVSTPKISIIGNLPTLSLRNGYEIIHDIYKRKQVLNIDLESSGRQELLHIDAPSKLT